MHWTTILVAMVVAVAVTDTARKTIIPVGMHVFWKRYLQKQQQHHQQWRFFYQRQQQPYRSCRSSSIMLLQNQHHHDNQQQQQQQTSVCSMRTDSTTTTNTYYDFVHFFVSVSAITRYKTTTTPKLPIMMMMHASSRIIMSFPYCQSLSFTYHNNNNRYHDAWQTQKRYHHCYSPQQQQRQRQRQPSTFIRSISNMHDQEEIIESSCGENNHHQDRNDDNKYDENSHSCKDDNDSDNDNWYSHERLVPPFDRELYDFYRCNFASHENTSNRGSIPKLPSLSSVSDSCTRTTPTEVSNSGTANYYKDKDNNESFNNNNNLNSNNQDVHDDLIYILRLTRRNHNKNKNSIVAALRLTRRSINKSDKKLTHSKDDSKQQCYTFLRALCVSKDYRKQGLALQLMNQSMKDFSSQISTTCCDHDGNPKKVDHYYYCFASSNLQPLYERAGFKRIDVTPPTRKNKKVEEGEDASSTRITPNTTSTRESDSLSFVPNWLIKSFLSMKSRVDQKQHKRENVTAFHPEQQQSSSSLELFVKNESDDCNISSSNSSNQLSLPALYSTKNNSKDNNASSTSRKIKIILLQHVNEQNRKNTATGWLLNDELYYHHSSTTEKGCPSKRKQKATSHHHNNDRIVNDNSGQNHHARNLTSSSSLCSIPVQLSDHFELELWTWSGRKDNDKIEQNIIKLELEFQQQCCAGEEHDDTMKNSIRTSSSSDTGDIILLWTESGGQRQFSTKSNQHQQHKQQHTLQAKTYIILDGTWQEAKQIFRKNPKLWKLERDSIQEAPPSIYTLRGDYTGWRQRFSSTNPNHSTFQEKKDKSGKHDKLESDGGDGGLLCTTEVVAALLDKANDPMGAQEIRQRLEAFQQYQTR